MDTKRLMALFHKHSFLFFSVATIQIIIDLIKFNLGYTQRLNLQPSQLIGYVIGYGLVVIIDYTFNTQEKGSINEF